LASQLPSAIPFDLDEANKKTSKRFGYLQYEYWNIFTALDIPKLMNEELKRFLEVNNRFLPSPDPAENEYNV
jgi:branched-subunit amino acid transport protein